MSVELLAIKFNHDTKSFTNDALNIRRNAIEPVVVPEWRRGMSKPEESLAAYAMRETSNNVVTIQAQFRTVEFYNKTIEIRALEPFGKVTLPWWLVLLFFWLLLLLGLPIPFNVLGRVATTQVKFGPSGVSDFVSFVLHFPLWNVPLWKLKVAGIFLVKWHWQYRQLSGPWKNFDTSAHKIYTVLEVPKLPWKQSPYDPANDQLPWTEVMDYSCIWAAGSKDTDTAAAKVTERVNALGPSIIEYDCPGGGETQYAWPNFNCTEFLELLGGGLGLGKYVNCTDCATIVSTFANILGCDLWQSRMGYSFALNEILAIGSSVWQTPCYGVMTKKGGKWGGSFGYHEVAWSGTCNIDDKVFDACLKVDGDSDPTGGPPHTPLLPTNMSFGNTGDLLYRDRLASPAGRPNCNPQPTTKKRRQVI